MTDMIRSLTLNARLALTAFVLGFVALFAGNPYKGAAATLNTKELAITMATNADQISVTTVADWIIQGRSDFRVVDLRPAAAFAEYHIPPAENIPVTELGGSNLGRNEKIILYSESGARDAQAWMLLRAKGYRGAYVLHGGLEAWKDSILFPRVPANATPAQLVDFARIKDVSKYFGGSPQAGAGDSTTTAVVMPKLAMPTPSATPAAGAPKKKKKEGC